ncbi:serine hydrolase domain-containing protein [Paenibacillus sp. JTLBN-2024]
MSVSERMDREGIPGLSIAFVEDGLISHRETWGKLAAGETEPVRMDAMFNACSISKFAASVLALVLVEENASFNWMKKRTGA